jgi:heat shock protein HslJ
MRRLIAVAMLLVVAACDETPTAPSQDELAGRWRVSSIRLKSAHTITPPGSVDLAVEFTGDRVSVQSDCNTCSGLYALNGETIMMPLLACTRRACPEGSLEGPFLELLSTAQTAAIVGETVLVVGGPRGELLFHR